MGKCVGKSVLSSTKFIRSCVFWNSQYKGFGAEAQVRDTKPGHLDKRHSKEQKKDPDKKDKCSQVNISKKGMMGCQEMPSKMLPKSTAQEGACGDIE